MVAVACPYDPEHLVGMLCFEPLLHQAERHALVSVVRAHPDWTLRELLTQLGAGGRYGTALQDVTIGELLTAPAPLQTLLLSDGDEPPVDPARLSAAQRAKNGDFDRHVREVIAEANGRAVGAAYLRVRVGGPRWKLQASLRRLADAEVIEQRGRTSATLYKIPAREQP